MFEPEDRPPVNLQVVREMVDEIDLILAEEFDYYDEDEEDDDDE